jgi:twitching motility protein PilT
MIKTRIDDLSIEVNSQVKTLDVLLQQLGLAILQGVSDIHLLSEERIRIRHLGKIQSFSDQCIGHALLVQLCQHWLTEAQQEQLSQFMDLDVRVSLAVSGDCRAHIAYQYHGLSVSLRPLPQTLPSMKSLHLPVVLESLLLQKQGLILVTGATGSGKSTSLSAMIHHLNQTQQKHIICLEDPIERFHPSLHSLVQQREIGRHCLSFTQGLYAAMRQDPDVLMIGELRDLDTIRMALTASETGHLVLATLHTSCAAQAIDRLVDVFPATEKAFVQTLLSQSLTAVLYQELVLSSSAALVQQRLPLYEVLIATPAVRHIIKEAKTAQLNSVMQTGQAQGMQTRQQAIDHWLAQGYRIDEIK